jgi:hypothetical protein
MSELVLECMSELSQHLWHLYGVISITWREMLLGSWQHVRHVKYQDYEVGACRILLDRQSGSIVGQRGTEKCFWSGTCDWHMAPMWAHAYRGYTGAL